MRRGDVRWYKFRRPDKSRPILILTRNSALEFLGEVTIAPVTSTIRDIPSEVRLSAGDGMRDDCAVNFDHVQTISKGRVGGLITTLSNEKMSEAKSAIQFALGL